MANIVNPQIEFQHTKLPTRTTHKKNLNKRNGQHWPSKTRISTYKMTNIVNAPREFQHTKSPTMATKKEKFNIQKLSKTLSETFNIQNGQHRQPTKEISTNKLANIGIVQKKLLYKVSNNGNAQIELKFNIRNGRACQRTNRLLPYKMANIVNPQKKFQHTKLPTRVTHKKNLNKRNGQHWPSKTRISIYKMTNIVNAPREFQHTKWPKKATHKNSFKYFNIQNRISIDRRSNLATNKKFNKQSLQQWQRTNRIKFQYKTAKLGNEQIKF